MKKELLPKSWLNFHSHMPRLPKYVTETCAGFVSSPPDASSVLPIHSLPWALRLRAAALNHTLLPQLCWVITAEPKQTYHEVAAVAGWLLMTWAVWEWGRSHGMRCLSCLQQREDELLQAVTYLYLLLSLPPQAPTSIIHVFVCSSIS